MRYQQNKMRLFIPQQMKVHQRIELLRDSERTWRRTLSIAKRHKDGWYVGNTQCTPRSGVRTRQADTRHEDRYIYTLHRYIFLDAHAPRVGEMAWTNEATRQVLSILPDTRSRQPTSRPVGMSRLRYALTLFRIA